MVSKKVMVSAAISWHGVTKPFFLNSNAIKVNKGNYCRHLRKELFLAIEKVVKCDDLKKMILLKMERYLIDSTWYNISLNFVPSSIDVTAPDYSYWDFKTKV